MLVIHKSIGIHEAYEYFLFLNVLEGRGGNSFNKELNSCNFI